MQRLFILDTWIGLFLCFQFYLLRHLHLLFLFQFFFLCHLLWGHDDWLTSTNWAVVVSVEKSLNGWSWQEQCILFNLLHIITLPIVFLVRLRFVKVISVWLRLVRGFHFLLQKALPIKVSHPDMLFDFLWSIETKSIAWLSLQTLVDEVSCLKWPSLWQFISLDWHLLGKYHISNLSPTLTDIWSSSKHKFITNDTHCEIINSLWMVLSAHHLRCHVAWCSWSIGTVFSSEYFGDSHVCDTYISILFHDNVLWLYISVSNVLLVHVVDCEQDLFDHMGCLSLGQSLLLDDVIIQFTTSYQFSNDIEFTLVFEKLENAHDMWMISFLQNFKLLFH